LQDEVGVKLRHGSVTDGLGDQTAAPPAVYISR
jgi:hypothetical protein